MSDADYVTQVYDSPLDMDQQAWDALLHQQTHITPFMHHAYLAALHASGSATPATGWAPHFITLEQAGQLVAACPLYVKSHSYGEYVFDWAWANAYAHHGLAYYPKAVVAVPFTPVSGSRLLARDAPARQALLRAVRSWCQTAGMSSLHLLFASDEDMHTCTQGQSMTRQTVQFHWQQAAQPWPDFDSFLQALSQDKRKKIKQERRKVAEAGVRFRWLRGSDIQTEDWDFFYRCYAQTYREHGNAPYLSRDFFDRMARTMPEHWVLFIAERHGRAIASSLIAIDALSTGASAENNAQATAYGRYWGALERVDCLHFEACYYQPLQWCIAHGITRFEGGAQGEHKMARALLPLSTHSAHWLEDAAFSTAVAQYVARESQATSEYLQTAQAHSPFRHNTL
jgi:uncharacterized protein